LSDPGDLVLALDQGGHTSRAVLFDADGHELTEAHTPVTTYRDGPDRVEHDPDELASSLRLAAEDVCESRAARGRRIRVAGLSCQRSTIVCWDRQDGRALSRALSWQDRRDAAFLERLRPREAWIRRRTGLVLSPHYGANKLRWCLETLPSVRDAAATGRLAAGPLSSFLLARLLENRPVCVDPSNAARTLLFDPDTRHWVPELLEAFGVPAGALPQPVTTRHDYGWLRIANREIPLTACTGDQAAAVFAFGDPQTGHAWLNVGTGAFLQRAIPAGTEPVDGLLKSVLYSDESGALCSLEGTVNGAGAALEWLEPQIALDVARAVQALPEPVLARAPLFINGVGGLGSPWWRAEFPVEFTTAGGDLERVAAVIESIAFMVCVNLEVMRGAGALTSLTATGGLARSDYLCRAVADLAALAVERPELREATARGTAFLAAGRPACWRVPPLERRFAPAGNATLAARFQRWREEMARRGA
jgi:glycerol kinase